MKKNGTTGSKRRSRLSRWRRSKKAEKTVKPEKETGKQKPPALQCETTEEDREDNAVAHGIEVETTRDAGFDGKKDVPEENRGASFATINRQNF